MALQVPLARSFGWGPINDDVVGRSAHALWVIDGATGIGGQALDAPSDARWFAQTASLAVAAVLAASHDIATPDLVGGVIRRCIASFEAEASRILEAHHDLPSAAFALVRVLPGHIESASLGDCRAIVRDAGGRIAEYEASTAAAFEARTLASVDAALAGDPVLTLKALQQKVRPALIENRRWMNRAGGYWVLGLQPRAVDHLAISRIPLQDCEIVVASDGFLRLIDLFKLATPADLLAIEAEAALDEWYCRLRTAE